MLLHRLQHGNVANWAESLTSGAPGTFARGILQTELNRIYLQFECQLVYDSFYSKRRGGRAGSPICRHLRLVQDNVVAIDQIVLDVVRTESTYTSCANRRSRERSRLKGQVYFRSRNQAVGIWSASSSAGYVQISARVGW